MLRPYDAADFDLLHSWITDAELLFRFAGPEFNFPLTGDQLQRYSNAHPDRKFYICCRESAPYAFGEIIPQGPGSVRLGRLLVGEPSQRGQGWGTAFVQELLAKAAMDYGAVQADLFVWVRNTTAIRCYRKAGFSFTEEPPLRMRHEGRVYNLRKMSRRIGRQDPGAVPALY